MLSPLIFIISLLVPQVVFAHGGIGIWGTTAPPIVLEAPSPSAGTSVARSGPMQGWESCVAAILEAEKRYGIPNNYLLAISLTESGRRTEGGSVAPWPWTVNAEGVGRYFTDREEALAWVRENQRQGKRSIDIGCMQINLRWHPKAFTDLESGFDPAVNVDYAARLLSSLRQSHGSWKEAVGRYHSHTSKLKTAYAGRVERNLRFIQAVKEELAEADTSVLAEAPPPAREDPSQSHSGGAGLSWGDWFQVARADGNQGLFAGLYAPVLPDYE